ncbi:MAG: 30S ribosomal protein S9 [Deltaproteobacteria bacterium]|nr:30S ribosomal protein S9 [Deltaproteobacteria bacterium]
MANPYLQHTVGKRKTSVARLYMKEGGGNIRINQKAMDEYYLRPTSKMLIMQPFELTNTVGKYDLNVNVTGGGLQGQAGAIRHALARALSAISPEYRSILKRAGLITRDAREKERKLPGQPGARKKFQFSKR